MPRPKAITCPKCGWGAEYTRAENARRGLKHHLARGCEPWTTSRTSDAAIAAANARARSRTTAAGYTPEATPEQWMARWAERPELYDDLLRVLGGTSLASIERDRRRVA